MAETIILDYRKSRTTEQIDTSPEDLPPEVFMRASVARNMLDASMKGHPSESFLQSISREDDLSLLTEEQEDIDYFDKKKRSILERYFAVDKDVRHGKLIKHLQ